MAFSFDASTKRITLSSGTTSISVRDLWSRYVDWWLTSNNSGIAPIAMAQVGGNDIDLTAGTTIPIFIFLQNGWKLKPQEANHTLAVTDGILLVDGGGDPFVNTTGSYTVRINYQQPVQAITVATGGGGGGATAAQIWEYVLEGSLSAEEVLRIVLAALAGRTAGVGTTTERYKSVDGTIDRLTVGFAGAGERSSVTLDGA